jgi:hypothetical protein
MTCHEKTMMSNWYAMYSTRIADLLGGDLHLRLRVIADIPR